jgi:hypothetical protein
MLEPWTPPGHPLAIVVPGRKLTPQSEVEALANKLRGAKEPVIMTKPPGRNSRGFEALLAFANAYSRKSCSRRTRWPQRHPARQSRDQHTAETLV